MYVWSQQAKYVGDEHGWLRGSLPSQPTVSLNKNTIPFIGRHRSASEDAGGSQPAPVWLTSALVIAAFFCLLAILIAFLLYRRRKQTYVRPLSPNAVVGGLERALSSEQGHMKQPTPQYARSVATAVPKLEDIQKVGSRFQPSGNGPPQ
jgi:hypothetical protein